MKKIDLTQTVSILANLGVIIGIIFLGIEIRQTNNTVAGTAYQARALAIMQQQEMLAESTYLAPALLKMNEQGLESLDQRERLRLNLSSAGDFHRVDGIYYKYERGLLDEEYYRTVFDAEMRLWVPRWRDYGIIDSYRERGLIRPSFDREIEKYLGGTFVPLINETGE